MESEADHWRLLTQGDRSPLLPVKWERRDIGYGMNYRIGSRYTKISNEVRLRYFFVWTDQTDPKKMDALFRTFSSKES